MKIRTKMVRRQVKILKNPTPSFVSLVDHGANQTPFAVVKNKDGVKIMANRLRKKTVKGAAPKVKAKKHDMTAETLMETGGVHRIIFAKSYFPTQKKVESWLRRNQWEDFDIEETKKGFVVKSVIYEEDDFEDLREINLGDGEEGISVFVGHLVDEDEEDEKTTKAGRRKTPAPAPVEDDDEDEDADADDKESEDDKSDDDDDDDSSDDENEDDDSDNEDDDDASGDEDDEKDSEDKNDDENRAEDKKPRSRNVRVKPGKAKDVQDAEEIEEQEEDDGSSDDVSKDEDELDEEAEDEGEKARHADDEAKRRDRKTGDEADTKPGDEDDDDPIANRRGGSDNKTINEREKNEPDPRTLPGQGRSGKVIGDPAPSETSRNKAGYQPGASGKIRKVKDSYIVRKGKVLKKRIALEPLDTYVKKFDGYAVYLSGGETLKEVLADGMVDGVPPGVSHIFEAMYKAVGNILKDGDDIEQNIGVVASEFREGVVALHGVWKNLLKNGNKAQKAAAKAYFAGLSEELQISAKAAGLTEDVINSIVSKAVKPFQDQLETAKKTISRFEKGIPSRNSYGNDDVNADREVDTRKQAEIDDAEFITKRNHSSLFGSRL